MRFCARVDRTLVHPDRPDVPSKPRTRSWPDAPTGPCPAIGRIAAITGKAGGGGLFSAASAQSAGTGRWRRSQLATESSSSCAMPLSGAAFSLVLSFRRKRKDGDQASAGILLAQPWRALPHLRPSLYLTIVHRAVEPSCSRSQGPYRLGSNCVVPFCSPKKEPKKGTTIKAAVLRPPT